MAKNRITVQGLTEAAKASKVYIHSFHLKKNNHSLFCFFEGYDHAYYYDKIRHITHDDFVIIICGNKGKTLDAYDQLYNKNKGNVKMAFFVDRDFDELKNNPAIYETEGYSIENYYCSWEVFSRILQYGFKVNKDIEDWNGIKEFYHQNIEEFHQVVEDFNAFYSLLRKYNREHNGNYMCNLGSTFDSSLGKIKIGGFVKNYNLQDLFDKYTGGQVLFSEKDLEKEANRLVDGGASKMFRGKYELEFMCVILRYIINDSNNRKLFIKNKQIKDNISQDTIMGNYCQYAEYPTRLRQYIENKY